MSRRYSTWCSAEGTPILAWSPSWQNVVWSAESHLAAHRGVVTVVDADSGERIGRVPRGAAGRDVGAAR